MRHTKFLCVALAIGGLVGCMNLEKRGARVEIEIQEEKLQFIKQYRGCLKKYSGKSEADRCEEYQKAIQMF